MPRYIHSHARPIRPIPPPPPRATTESNLIELSAIAERQRIKIHFHDILLSQINTAKTFEDLEFIKQTFIYKLLLKGVPTPPSSSV